MRVLSNPVKRLLNKAPVGRRLVLHVGPHKTATTYVQENLFAARAELAKAGWYYPLDPVDGRAGQHGLSLASEAYLSEDGQRREILDGWAEEARDANQSMIFSTEGLCRWKPERLDQLAEILGFDTYEIVYAIRDPLELFPSLWAEEIKHGRTWSFAERFAREIAQPLQSRILNPVLDVLPWLEREWVQVHAIPFDALWRRDIDVYAHITDNILGVSNLTPAIKHALNRKNSIEVTEFLRLITLVHHKGVDKNGSDLRFRFMEYLTPELAEKIRQLMLEEGKEARRNIPMRGHLGFREAVENGLKRKLEGRWSLELEEDEHLFSKESRVFPYYSAFVLSVTPPVMEAAQDILQKIYD